MTGSVIDRRDGHGPQYGCRWTGCGNASASKPCPFTKDTAISEPQPIVIARPSCSHEYRQLLKLGDAGTCLVPDGFYCVHCLTTTS